jgi:mono/diheme cytochrome c family protein
VFSDGREQRLPVAGTVARGGSQLNEHLYLGKSGGGWAKSLPMPATPQLVKRGQERFNIYCSPCHGIQGMGNGPVAKRAEALQEGTWVPPTSLHADHVRAQPDGEIFNTITNGIRSMYPYGSRVPPEDRWAIILYVRALQLSQAAKVSDVPAEVVPTLK